MRTGDSLSECFDRYPKVFPEFYRGILRSAEMTGQLDVVLAQLSLYLERDLEATRKVKSAMVYPMIVAGMALLTIVILAGFVLPRFKVFFEDLGAKLPLPTRMLLAFTDFFGQWWWAIGVGCCRTRRRLRPRDANRPRSACPRQDRAEDPRRRRRHPVRDGRALLPDSLLDGGPPASRCRGALRVATDSLHNLVFERGAGGVAGQMFRGKA